MRTVAPSKVYRLLYPAVPVVVAATCEGKVSAMSAVSVISLSNEPAMIGISSSPSHDTYGTIVRVRCFSVSWLDKRHIRTVEGMGSSSGAGIRDKLRAAGLHYRLKGSPAVPIIREASAYLSCTLARAERFGDHELIAGEVREARAIGDFGDYWAFKLYHPILYSGMGRPHAGRAQPVRRP